MCGTCLLRCDKMPVNVSIVEGACPREGMRSRGVCLTHVGVQFGRSSALSRPSGELQASVRTLRHGLERISVCSCLFLGVKRRWLAPCLEGNGASTVLLARKARSYLVDPASSHMLVSKTKPCMSKYKPLHGETANGSLNQLWFLRS